MQTIRVYDNELLVVDQKQQGKLMQRLQLTVSGQKMRRHHDGAGGVDDIAAGLAVGVHQVNGRQQQLLLQVRTLPDLVQRLASLQTCHSWLKGGACSRLAAGYELQRLQSPCFTLANNHIQGRKKYRMGQNACSSQTWPATKRSSRQISAPRKNPLEEGQQMARTRGKA